MPRLAESDEGLEREAVGINGHSDVDFAAAGGHLHGGAGKGGGTGFFMAPPPCRDNPAEAGFAAQGGL